MTPEITKELSTQFDEKQFIEIKKLEIGLPHKEGMASVLLYWRFYSPFGNPYCHSSALVKFPMKQYPVLSGMLGQLYEVDEFFKKLNIKIKED